MKNVLISICILFFLPAQAFAHSGQQLQDSLSAYEPEVKEMIGFLQYMLNTLGSESTAYSAKETIIYQSYTKLFESATVQVEDDLDPTRSTSLHKDVIAYLKDVDFFYQNASFQLDITDISQGQRSRGQAYIKVSLNRTLKGLSINGDSVSNVRPRYVEINIDESEQDLRIVSIYTHEADDAEDYAQWWQGLSLHWRQLLRKAASLPDTPEKRDWAKLRNIRSLDLAGDDLIVDLHGIEKLSSLQTLSLNRTAVSDLSPLRYLNELRVLDISHTPISDISPLRFNWQLEELDISMSSVRNLSALADFKKLSILRMNGMKRVEEKSLPQVRTLTGISARSSGISDLGFFKANSQVLSLDLSSNPIDDFGPVTSFVKLKKLDLSDTQFSEPALLTKLIALEVLRINRCPVADLTALAGLSQLQKIWCDQSGLSAKALSDWKTLRPDVLVIFETKELQNWFLQFSPEMREKLLERVGAKEPNSEAVTLITQLDSLSLEGQSPQLSLLNRMQGLRVLQVTHAGLKDLKGLEGMRQLRKVSFAENPLTNVWALQNCPFLERVDLSNTQITDLDALSTLPALTWLNIDGGNVSEEQIKSFSLAHPAVSVVHHSKAMRAWWSGLSGAWQEAIRANMDWKGQEVDAEMLAAINRKGKLRINAGSHEIESLDALSKFWGLHTLHIEEMRGFRGSDLPAFARLRSLAINNMQVEDWDFLERFPQLTELDLQNTTFERAASLRHLSQLEVLDLSGTPIRNIGKISDLLTLTSLSIANTRVANIRPLDDLPNLIHLECFNTRISRFAVQRFQEDHPACKVRYY